MIVIVICDLYLSLVVPAASVYLLVSKSINIIYLEALLPYFTISRVPFAFQESEISTTILDSSQFLKERLFPRVWRTQTQPPPSKRREKDSRSAATRCAKRSAQARVKFPHMLLLYLDSFSAVPYPGRNSERFLR